MQAIDIDLFVTIVISTALFGSAALALSVLPWSEQDVERTAGAALRVGSWTFSGVSGALRAAAGRPVERSAHPAAA